MSSMDEKKIRSDQEQHRTEQEQCRTDQEQHREDPAIGQKTEDMIREMAEDIEIPRSVTPEAVEEALEKRRREQRRSRFRKNGWKYLAGAAAACLCLAVGIPAGYQALNGNRAALGSLSSGGSSSAASSSGSADTAGGKESGSRIYDENRIVSAKDYDQVYDYIEARKEYLDSMSESVSDGSAESSYDTASNMGSASSAGTVKSESSASYSGVEGAASWSDTNVREEGVGEGDVVKTDGENLYLLNGQKINIVSAAAGELNSLSEITMEDSDLVTELYVENGRLVVIYSSSVYEEGTASAGLEDSESAGEEIGGGETAEAETRRVEEWMAAREENRGTAVRMCALMMAADISAHVSAVDTERALKQAHRKMDSRRWPRLRRWARALQRTATFLLIPIIAIASLKVFNRDKVENRMLEFKTAPGTTASAELPDGTGVVLNSSSTLRYPARFDGGERDVDRHSERHISVFIRSCHLDQRHIASEGSGTVELLGVAESDRQIIADSLPHALPVVCSGEECVRDEDSGVALLGVGSLSECHQLNDADISEFPSVAPAAESLDQEFGGVGESAQIEGIAGLNDADRLIGRNDLGNLSHGAIRDSGTRR